MRVIVTGASGFLGMNLVRHLVDEGHDVLALSRSSKSREAFVDRLGIDLGRVQFLHGDVRDRQLVEGAIDDFHPTNVIHAAAVTPTAEMEVRDPLSIIEINEVSTVHLLCAAAAAGVERFLFVSSAAVYAGGGDAALTEDAETRSAGGLYALTKLASERYCAWATERFGIDTRIARLGPVYGPYERPTASRRNMSQAYRAVSLALDGSPIICNSRDTEFDWVHGHDAAQALRLILAVQDVAHRTYNVAGEPITMERLLGAVSAAIPGVDVKWVGDSEEANLPVPASAPRPGLDISLISQDLEYRPDFTLESGIESYVAWLRTAGPAT